MKSELQLGLERLEPVVRAKQNKNKTKTNKSKTKIVVSILNSANF